nr:HAD hydrolase-like protein [Brachybacterium epidermidis]
MLLDTESIWNRAQAAVVETAGARLRAEDHEHLHGSTIEVAAEIIAERAGAPEPEVLAQLHEAFDRELAVGIRAMPGATAAVEAAAARVPLGCASNSWLEALEGKLAAGGLREHFTVLEASDTVARPKPAPTCTRPLPVLWAPSRSTPWPSRTPAPGPGPPAMPDCA